MLVHINERHFRVKINIYKDIAKIQFFSMVYRLGVGWGQHAYRGWKDLVCLLEKSSTILPNFNSTAIFSPLFPNFPGVQNFLIIKSAIF